MNISNNLDLDKLTNSWTAVVKQNNGQIVTIWHTAWPSIKDMVKEVISVSSDYPRFSKNLK